MSKRLKSGVGKHSPVSLRTLAKLGRRRYEINFVARHSGVGSFSRIHAEIFVELERYLD